MTLANYRPRFKIDKFSIIFEFRAKFHFSMSFHKGRLDDGSQRSWPIGQKLSNVKILAQYHPLGPHLALNQSKKLSGQDLAAFVAKKIIKNVKNREMTSFFKRIPKGCRGPDFLSWPSGQKHPRKLFSRPKGVLADAQELLSVHEK